MPGPSGEQGLVLDQRMPSVGVELGDRKTTRAKAWCKLNRDGKQGKQETCLVLGTSFGNRMVLFDPIHVGHCVLRPGKIPSPEPASNNLGAPEFF